MSALTDYYNKFNEDKRLNSRHGQVEYRTSMRYIHRFIEKRAEELSISSSRLRILDIGAGTGRYSLSLAKEGNEVTAVELVRHNISRLRQKAEREGLGEVLHTYQADARSMPRLPDDTFDITLLFGPMYHLMEKEQQLAALREAKRVTAPGGYLLAAYVMNEYAVLTYAFKERHITEALRDGLLDDNYHCTAAANPLYHMVRLEEMEELGKRAELRRVQVIAADGAANYMRPFINALSEQEFEEFMRYHFSVCERMDLMGASAHTVDILQKAEVTNE